MTRRAGYLLLIGVLACLYGCSTPLTPIEVAEQFWRGLEQGDTDTVRKHIKREDAVDLKLEKDVLPINGVALGRTVIEKETAVIDTSVTVAGDRPVTLPLKTRLQLEGGVWKVDYKATVSTISSHSELAKIMDQIRDFGSALQQGIEKSVDELERALPQIEKEIARIEERVKQKVPELRERIEEFTRNLEKALEGLKPEDAPEPASPIAI